MNDNPKNNILMSENIRQKRLTILEYFSAYIYHHYQPKTYVFRLIMMTNICIEIFQNCLSFLSDIFRHEDVIFWIIVRIILLYSNGHLLKTFFHSISISSGGHLGVFGPILTFMFLYFLRTIQHFFL